MCCGGSLYIGCCSVFVWCVCGWSLIVCVRWRCLCVCLCVGVSWFVCLVGFVLVVFVLWDCGVLLSVCVCVCVCVFV